MVRGRSARWLVVLGSAERFLLKLRGFQLTRKPPHLAEFFLRLDLGVKDIERTDLLQSILRQDLPRRICQGVGM